MVLLFSLAGGGYGAWIAKKRGGSRADIAQYAAGFAIAFALLGLFAAIFINRGL